MKKDDRLGWNTEQEYNTRKQAVISPHFSRDCRNLARGSGLELPPTSSGTAQMKHDAELGEGGAPTLLRFCPRDEYVSVALPPHKTPNIQQYTPSLRKVT